MATFFNLGHHMYMGGHVDELEQLLRNAFPGQDEDFYNYGEVGRRCIPVR